MRAHLPTLLLPVLLTPAALATGCLHISDEENAERKADLEGDTGGVNLADYAGNYSGTIVLLVSRTGGDTGGDTGSGDVQCEGTLDLQLAYTTRDGHLSILGDGRCDGGALGDIDTDVEGSINSDLQAMGLIDLNGPASTISGDSSWQGALAPGPPPALSGDFEDDFGAVNAFHISGQFTVHPPDGAGG